MTDAWLGINSGHYDSSCGEYLGCEVWRALDGISHWYHDGHLPHWFILDLGAPHRIKKVRGRSDQAIQDPIDVDIYVSNNKEDWGAAVATGISTWRDTIVWVEIDTTDKVGRYIKVVINETEYDPELAFGCWPYLTIFDAYGELLLAPTVTTQAVSSIEGFTATGNGTITNTGTENCDKRGVCWNTTGSPTVVDDKAEETDSFGTGAFTSSMTGLLPGTHYYVKAYAHNAAGYSYGSEVEFDTKSYYSSGYIGDVIDCTALVDTYDRLEWTKELPSADQAVAVKIRSSPDESTWSEWKTIYSSPCTSFNTPVQRYLEWKATLLTDDPSYTPKLEELSFYWTKKVE